MFANMQMAQNMKENGTSINIMDLALYAKRMEVIQKDNGPTANLKVLWFKLTIKHTSTKVLSKMGKKKVWEKKFIWLSLSKEHLKMTKDMEEENLNQRVMNRLNIMKMASSLLKMKMASLLLKQMNKKKWRK